MNVYVHVLQRSCGGLAAVLHWTDITGDSILQELSSLRSTTNGNCSQLCLSIPGIDNPVHKVRSYEFLWIFLNAHGDVVSARESCLVEA